MKTLTRVGLGFFAALGLLGVLLGVSHQTVADSFITSAGAVFALPAAADTLVGRASTDTLTNKTLSAGVTGNVLKFNGNTVAATTGTATLTFPNATQTMIGGSNLCTVGNWCQQTTTLTDAQTKALPTTPITVVAAAGSSVYVQPLFAYAFAKTSSGAYTNINAAAYMTISWAGGEGALGYVANDASITTGSATRLSDMLGVANTKRARFLPYVDTEGVNGWGPFAVIEPNAYGQNDALRISINNQGSGALTGGNAANTLTVLVVYFVVTVP